MIGPPAEEGIQLDPLMSHALSSRAALVTGCRVALSPDNMLTERVDKVETLTQVCAHLLACLALLVALRKRTTEQES